MPPVKLYRRKTFRALVTCSLCLSFVSCGGDGFLGLQDYQRDLLSAVAGGLAGALLMNMAAELGPPADSDGRQPMRGVPGPQGPEGPPGPTFFSVYIDQFFGAQFEDGFKVVPVPNDAPTLGLDAVAVGYRLAIPSTYRVNDVARPATGRSPDNPNPITMRLFLYRRGVCDGGCFIFTVDARRLQAGDSEPQCYGGTAADCSDGTRWILADRVCSDGDGDVVLYFVVDVPLMAGGLEFPEVFAGDYLAFELNPVSDDGGSYRLLGVEFFESSDAQLVNATVFPTADSLPEECEPSPVRPSPGPDCNGNGIPDVNDVADGTSEDCNTNGVPDECDITDGRSEDVNGNGIPDECEPDCNGNGIPDDWDISRGTGLDCNTNGIPDECDIADGRSEDVNGNGIPDECEPDCNGNGIPDDWDISHGTSRDCNGNGVPDECDITDGTSNDVNGNGIPDECEPDCNGNGIPDDWDISHGTSRDCNTNGVPDECDIADGTSDDVNGNGIPDECEEGESCCDYGKPRILTMQYAGTDCSTTSHSQDPDMVTCEDFALLPERVFIVSSNQPADGGNPRIWFEGTVTLGETFDIDAANAGESRLKGTTHIHIFDFEGGALLQTVEFHSSCSQPLAHGDQFGASPLVDCIGEDEGAFCVRGAKPQVLTMRYTGEDCSASSHSQDPSKVSCDGDPMFDPEVRIRASNKSDPNDGRAKVWFDGTVLLDATFDIDATNAGESKLRTATWVHVFNVNNVLLQTIRFHTSCSQPLTQDDQFGSVVLIGFVPE